MTTCNAYICKRDGTRVLRIMGHITDDGLLRGPDSEVVINGKYALELGIDVAPIQAMMRARQFDDIIDAYPHLLARLGDNPTGLTVTAEEDELAARRVAANARLLAEHADSAPTGNNRKTGHCDRCDHGVPPGYGTLRRCAADTGCPQHMHYDGWHLECVDRDACDRRMAADAVADRQARLRDATVFLSSRGWGDYSPVQWRGDLTRDDADIMAEMQELLARADDVDTTSPDLLTLINHARRAGASK